MAAPDQPLQFAPWHPGQALILSARGFYQPTQLYPTCTPTIILTPLLAIDAHGNRMGQGLGMYDRTLQAMPQMQTIGVGFASQLVKSLPTEPHDIPLQAFVCESGLYPMLA